MILPAFIFFLLLFLAVGLWASSKSIDNTEDYLLAGRKVSPWMAGLSAMASLMSGFMFIGFIGLVYKIGIYATWFFIGEISGILLLTPWLQQRIQQRSQQLRVQTFSGLLAKENGQKNHKLITLIGVLTMIFLGIYAAAQLTAGGKALNNLFNWPQQSGIFIGGIMLMLYSYKGGIRASLWTDSVQAVVMFLAMIALCIAGLSQIGGFVQLHKMLSIIDPNLVNPFPKGPLAAALFFGGWLFAGLAVYSLPHVAVRYMVVSNQKEAKQAQFIFLITAILFMLLSTVVALLARVLLSQLVDTEMALPAMTQLILPDVFIGIVLAGIFASSMSSADSMVLSCSAALSQDVLPSWSKKLSWAKRSTALVIASVMMISMWGPSGVFNLVVFAVGGMGSAFGPLLVLRALGKKPSENTAIAMIICGLGVSLFWRYGLHLNTQVFEAAPGVLSGFVVYGLNAFFTRE